MTKKNSTFPSLPRELRPLLLMLPLALVLSLLIYLETISVTVAFVLSIVFILCLFQLSRKYEQEMAELRRKIILQEHESRDTKASQLLLTSIMENLADPFLLLDARKRILMANKSALDMLGHDILRKDLSLFIRSHEVNDAIGETIESGTSHTVEYLYGNVMPRNLLVRIHALDIPSQDPASSLKRYIFLSIYDITPIKQAEQMRVDFVANASHELRTPLASILGFVETLQGPARNDREAQDRFLKIMYDEACRMTRLVDDLLSLSKIEREAHIPPSGMVNLPTLIDSVVETLAVRLRKKDMSVTFRNDDHIDMVPGDYDQLTQVFQNLLDNAIKYGRENSEIDIRLYKETATPPLDVQTCNVSITNAGAGIPPEHIPRLTERFYRVDTARSRSLGGTGLGLAIVKHILQRHKGHIRFESEVNKYTRVTVSLPQTNSEAPPK
ncbi:sensor histidine kinase [Luteithermobacter gelatinilyticus]|uniref:sensor histidine kinase n=1 Tax=Luteithermobacter gelatinilyticus TaxID=2582913 RepID=UPI0011064075|nr:ATP-binding protein [Luteithermobacter gelatinilyticus]